MCAWHINFRTTLLATSAFAMMPSKMRTVACAILALCAYTVESSTVISVLEVGKGGVLRRTTTANRQLSTDAVVSFWSAMHSPTAPGRKLQQKGMPLVPDAFNRADVGVVIGLTGSGVDMERMPMLSEMVREGEGKNCVGRMEIPGKHCHKLMSSVKDSSPVAGSVFAALEENSNKSGLSGFSYAVDGDSASNADAELSAALRDLDKKAQESGRSVVVYLVAEEDEAVGRRKKLTRRLEEEDQGENEEGGENQDNNGNGEQNIFYGWGYYEDGEWVTPYKSMFQIQYFNVVLWTSIGLAVVLFTSIYMMAFMPLEPDTLLFGESAKLVGDD